MKFLILMMALLLLCLGFTVRAQDTAPTLVPPTLVPTIAPTISDTLRTESGVTRLQRNGEVRVGIRYNAPPFGELNIRGEVTGFDADLARSMAEIWDVAVEFVQVTRQTGFEFLEMGQVDLLMGGQVHRRELDAEVEFSQTYYTGEHVMMVRQDDGAALLADLANRRVGVVVGSEGDRALLSWQSRTGLPVNRQEYLTLDRAYVALATGEIDGVVESRQHLLPVITQPDLVRFLEESVEPEPYAVAMPRQDIGLRQLVNRTLQYLSGNGRLAELYQAHLPGELLSDDLLAMWAGVGEDAPSPDQFASEIVYPAQYTVPQMLTERVIQVAGATTVAEDAPESARRLELLNRSLIEKMADRWGVSVQFLPDNAGNALEQVATGQADLAVGVQPDWGWVDRVDFTGSYLLHGERLLVGVDSGITGFTDLRGGKWVAIATNEPQMRDRAVEWAESVNARINIYSTREQDIAYSILVENNADVAYGDSLKLIPQVEQNPDQLQLTERWYSRTSLALAVPYNDVDFRMLVEYTLQEFVQDGTLESLLQPVMLADEIPAFDVWPGSSDYLGLSLASS